MRATAIAMITGALALGACTSTGNIERGAAGGAAGGAVLGAIIGNNTGNGDAGDGAAAGAAIGAVAGGLYGLGRDQGVGRQNQGYAQPQPAPGYGYAQPGYAAPAQQPLQRLYDQRVGRYYFYDPATGRSFWENGQPRS